MSKECYESAQADLFHEPALVEAASFVIDEKEGDSVRGRFGFSISNGHHNDHIGQPTVWNVHLRAVQYVIGAVLPCVRFYALEITATSNQTFWKLISFKYSFGGSQKRRGRRSIISCCNLFFFVKIGWDSFEILWSFLEDFAEVLWYLNLFQDSIKTLDDLYRQVIKVNHRSSIFFSA